jgi:hypothetical protein
MNRSGMSCGGAGISGLADALGIFCATTIFAMAIAISSTTWQKGQIIFAATLPFQKKW